MKNQYVNHENVTREILDTVKVGDLIKCNDWEAPMRVVGVSTNYFVMIQKAFGNTLYSVCEKIPCDHSRNHYNEDYFRIGTDDYIGGCGFGSEWDNADAVKKYLEEFESGETELSVRRAINLERISTKSA
jgi:hypothetical protein